MKQCGSKEAGPDKPMKLKVACGVRSMGPSHLDAPDRLHTIPWAGRACMIKCESRWGGDAPRTIPCATSLPASGLRSMLSGLRRLGPDPPAPAIRMRPLATDSSARCASLRGPPLPPLGRRAETASSGGGGRLFKGCAISSAAAAMVPMVRSIPPEAW